MKKKIILSGLIFFIMLTGVSFGEKEKVLSPADFERLSQEYFSKNDYDGFYSYLQGLLKQGYDKTPQVYYFLALSRLQQIGYWQKMKNWEGVYDKSVAFRKDIDQNLSKAVSLTQDDPELLLGIKYLKWQNMREEDPDNAAGAFDDMVTTARDTAKSGPAIEKIKTIADELSTLEDKNLSARLYEVYVEKLSASNLSDQEIKERGERFLKEGHVYLAKSVFGTYLDRLSGKNELQAREMVAIADKFAYNGGEEGLDPMFAETMYKKAFDLAGAAAFNKDSQYLRAFNLERMKDSEGSVNEYKNLLTAYPDYPSKQEVYFRIGVLAAYAQKNIALAEEYFTKIRDEFPKDPLMLSSLYQLGLLSQWKKDFDKAKGFYNALIEGAKTQGMDLEKNEIVSLAKERLKEIEEQKEIAYGLRLFLEGTFKEKEGPSFMNVDLTGRPAKEAAGKPVKFVATTSNPQTGCMTPNYSYEWSGEVGNVVNIPNSPELVTDYASASIKVVSVAVVGTGGPEGVGFDMVQVN